MKFLSIEWKDFSLYLEVEYPPSYCCLSLGVSNTFQVDCCIFLSFFFHVVKLWCCLNCSLKRNYNDWSFCCVMLLWTMLIFWHKFIGYGSNYWFWTCCYIVITVVEMEKQAISLSKWREEALFLLFKTQW